MAKKKQKQLPKRKGEFLFHGKTVDELKNMDLDEFSKYVPSKQRRVIKRGFNELQEKLLDSVNAGEENIRTHVRSMIILPQMVGMDIGIHNGKAFTNVTIQPEMLGHVFGEYAPTRGLVRHGSAGVGSTKSSKFVPLK
ncbi:MAG: 30S ribosomal protein S19 [Methanosarcinales archaeon]|nr:30S ribosomal protein S19 [Methanosarcinales archaeon]